MHSGARQPSDPARLFAVGANDDWSCSKRRASPKSETSILSERSFACETKTFLPMSFANRSGSKSSLRLDIPMNNLETVKMLQSCRDLRQSLFPIQSHGELHVLVGRFDQIRQRSLTEVKSDIQEVVTAFLTVVFGSASGGAYMLRQTHIESHLGGRHSLGGA